LTQNESSSAAGNLFADIQMAPAVRSLAQHVEHGGALPFSGVTPSAQPFFAALLQKLFPRRPIVVVTENLKTQESVHQDLETWLQIAQAKSPKESTGQPAASASATHLLFYPAWEILPQEGKLPHADVISERLETLVALSASATRHPQPATMVVTSVSALLQKTFAPDDLKRRARQLKRGDSIAPLDLVEFLEEQGYEPEAQVSQKGELSLRGGIVDLYPPTSPWPVRLEFFGDELESLRHFDPLTQISRDEISGLTIPPAGEIGILKSRGQPPGGAGQKMGGGQSQALATLLEHLPRETIFVLCEPESLAAYADNYAQQIPADDPFLFRGRIFWPNSIAVALPRLN
jgi:transcription-repair coupling factor (superfamily II helicase)